MLPAAVVRSLPGYKVWCSATGSPPIHIALIRNSKVLVNTTATANIRLYEEGNYTCVVTSRYGTNRSDFLVIFNGKTFKGTRISSLSEALNLIMYKIRSLQTNIIH